MQWQRFIKKENLKYIVCGVIAYIALVALDVYLRNDAFKFLVGYVIIFSPVGILLKSLISQRVRLILIGFLLTCVLSVLIGFPLMMIGSSIGAALVFIAFEPVFLALLKSVTEFITVLIGTVTGTY
jgi:hypothetical protein